MGGLRRLTGKLVRLFDQGANPVSLLAFKAGQAHPLDDFVAALVVEYYGVDRGAARWQLVQNGSVQISVGAHCQSARYRGGGHNQLVRTMASGHALFAQGQSLLDAKAVLLVDDYQCQPGKVDILLEQGMGANDHGAAGGNCGQCLAARFALELAGQPAGLDAQWFQPAAKVEIVLLGQNFRGCHQCNLITGLDGLQGCQRGNYCLAGTNITLDQTQHGALLLQIPGYFLANAQLCPGRGKSQLL